MPYSTLEAEWPLALGVAEAEWAAAPLGWPGAPLGWPGEMAPDDPFFFPLVAAVPPLFFRPLFFVRPFLFPPLVRPLLFPPLFFRPLFFPFPRPLVAFRIF